jgi:hypothetical protein
VITSNRDIEEWPPLFTDALLASAAMDRLLHHAHVIDIEGEFYRNPPSKRRALRARVAWGSGLPTRKRVALRSHPQPQPPAQICRTGRDHVCRPLINAT